MDSVVSNEDVLLVSMERIKGGADEAEPSILRVVFSFQKENQPEPNNQMMFTDDMSTFEIVKQVMHQNGISLNDFKELRDEEDNVVTFADKLEDGKAYKIVICAHHNCEEDNDDDCY